MYGPAKKMMFATGSPNAGLGLDVAGDSAPRSKAFMETSLSQTAYASLLASMIGAGELSKLTVAEYDILIAKLAGEVMTNPEIHDALKVRAAEALAELRA